MIVGELRHGQLAIIDRIRETVRLAEGLSPNGDLSIPARSRALECLSQFGQRLRDMQAGSVRAAGTSTIRRAREDTTFMAEAEQALGHPIEVISGIEEARLVYNGVTHSLPPNEGFRLVMDIGGGSTELILGQGARPHTLESLHMGCVAMTERFFGDGQITRKRFDRARLAARLELRPIKAFFRDTADIEAIGTSGTMLSTERVARSLGIEESGKLNHSTVDELIERVLEFDSIDKLAIQGLSERRSQVWPGGLAILAELLKALHVDELGFSDGALREGLLYDLLGRLQHEDARERTVRAMAARYHVDMPQSERVIRFAAILFNQCASDWSIDSKFYSNILEWSARLHEIGLDISHDGFQRHGAYVAEHADMPGFPRAEQRLIAFLIGSQRHSIDMRSQGALPRAWRVSALRLAILLRLAVLLNRSRSQEGPSGIELSVQDKQIDLGFDSTWLEANPLTVADLRREHSYLQETGYALAYG